MPKKQNRKDARLEAFVQALRDKDMSAAEKLIASGIDPTQLPSSVYLTKLHGMYLPLSALDWAVFLGCATIARGWLIEAPILDDESANRLVEMAAFGKNLSVLTDICTRYKGQLNLAHAFAFSLNHAFTDGALYLVAHGALDDAKPWIERSALWTNFKMHYFLRPGHMPRETKGDLFACAFSMSGIDAICTARGVEPATQDMRIATLKALADVGVIDALFYHELAIRALVFDSIETLDALDEICQMHASEHFKSLPADVKKRLVQPAMSARKIEIVAEILGPNYEFQLSPQMLTFPSSVHALIAHTSKERTRYPFLLTRYCVDFSMNEDLAHIATWGGITEDSISELIELARERNNQIALAFLLDYQNKHLKSNSLADIDPKVL